MKKYVNKIYLFNLMPNYQCTKDEFIVGYYFIGHSGLNLLSINF